MDDRMAKMLSDLELLLQTYPRVTAAKRETVGIAISYRLSQVEEQDRGIARQYRQRYINLRGEQ